jgi:hypothetical protein
LLSEFISLRQYIRRGVVSPLSFVENDFIDEDRVGLNRSPNESGVGESERERERTVESVHLFSKQARSGVACACGIMRSSRLSRAQVGEYYTADSASVSKCNQSLSLSNHPHSQSLQCQTTRQNGINQSWVVSPEHDLNDNIQIGSTLILTGARTNEMRDFLSSEKNVLLIIISWSKTRCRERGEQIQLNTIEIRN